MLGFSFVTGADARSIHCFQEQCFYHRFVRATDVFSLEYSRNLPAVERSLFVEDSSVIGTMTDVLASDFSLCICRTVTGKNSR